MRRWLLRAPRIRRAPKTVAMVVAEPPSTGTLASSSSNVTSPGPWCLNQVRLTGTPVRPALAMLPRARPSSQAQTVSAAGVPATASTGSPHGPPGPAPFGPSSAKASTGGVLPVSASPTSASIRQSTCRRPGIALRSPRTSSVHTTAWSPKSAGTVTVKTPQCLLGWNRVGLRAVEDRLAPSGCPRRAAPRQPPRSCGCSTRTKG